MEFEREILKGHIDTIILSVINHKAMYGYEVSKNMKQMNGNFEMKQSTLYESLKRLDKKKYLKGYWNDDERTGGGKRRYYQITQEGLKFLNEKVNEWSSFKKLVDNFLEVSINE